MSFVEARASRVYAYVCGMMRELSDRKRRWGGDWVAEDENATALVLGRGRDDERVP